MRLQVTTSAVLGLALVACQFGPVPPPMPGAGFFVLLWQRTELAGYPVAVLGAEAADQAVWAASKLAEWLPQLHVSVQWTGIVARVTRMTLRYDDCPPEWYALMRQDAGWPTGQAGYVALWVPPAGLPTCAWGWTWGRDRWAQVYWAAGSWHGEIIIHEFAHIAEAIARDLGYAVASPDEAARYGYSCEPAPWGCSWLRWLRDYLTGRCQCGIPAAVWQTGQTGASAPHTPER